MTRRIQVGAVPVGGGAAVSIQSMCNTPTEDVNATVRQIQRLEQAGCEIVRVAVPTEEAARAIPSIKAAIHIPLVADIHFDYRLALLCVDGGVDKIRINPGNIGSKDRVRAVADACRERGIPIRVGVNGGSLEKDLAQKYGGVTAEALAESALGHVRLLEECGFGDICISVKCSRVPVNMAAYELLHEKMDYPLHLGVTEAGNDIAVIVELLVLCGGKDINIGMSLAQSVKSLGSRNNAHELYRSGVSLLYLRNGVYSRAAGSKHGIENDNIALADIAGQLAVILNRLQSFGVAVKADVTDSGGGNEGQNAVNHAESGSENRNKGELLARKSLSGHSGNGSLNFNILERKISCCLIAHEHRYLAHESAELFGSGVLVSEDGQLMLDKRMICYCYVCHVLNSFGYYKI